MRPVARLFTALSALALLFTACKEQEQEIAVQAVSLTPPSQQLLIGESLKLQATITPENATDKTLSWASSQPSVAKVDETGRVEALAEGNATITAKAGGKSGSCQITVARKTIEVTSIELSETTLQLVENDEFTLTATVLPADAEDKTVTWTSTKPSVASVDNQGKVTALTAGQASIVARAGVKAAECAVTVEARKYPVESISLDPAALPNLIVGDKVQLRATVLPENAYDKTVTWSSSRPEVATVSENGLVEALKEGEATILAKAGDQSASCAVTVRRIPVQSLALDRDSLRLYEGEECVFQAFILPQNATYQAVTWRIADEKVALVDAAGKLTAKAKGNTVLTATADEQSAQCWIEVLASIASISLDRSQLRLLVGESATLVATVTPPDATLTEKISWSTSDEGVASVDENGRVTAVKEGSATVTVAVEGKKASCEVQVDYIPVETISLSATQLDLNRGDTLTLKAVLQPANATYPEIEWGSSDSQVASVTQTGLVTALQEGSATIYAKTRDKVASCQVNIIVPVSSVVLTRTSIRLKKGETATIEAIVNPWDATDKTVVWTSSDTDVATVKDGLVTAVGSGQATILAQAGGQEAECSVTVYEDTPPDDPTPDDPTPDDPTPDDPTPETGTLCTDIGQTPIVLAYYTEYSDELPDVTRLTHINYAHGRFVNKKTGDGGIEIAETSLLKKVVALKSKNPKLKVMLMIGGWGGNADGFSEMAKSATKRTAFCQAVKAHIDNYKLDGVDIDWEYPTQSADGETGCDPNDTQNFNLVLKELRETLGTKKIISFASASNAKYVDWGTAMQYLDYVNVMTYDMGAAPNGHNSPLYRSSKFNHRSCEESVDAHKTKGVPLSRQVMGVPFYGKAEKNPETKIFEYSVKYKEIPDILEKGLYKGKPLVKPVTRKWEATSKVPYLVDPDGKNVLSYDDPESVTCKGQFVVSKGLLGAMFWEYRHDSSDHALLKALVQAIYGKDTVTQ